MEVAVGVGVGVGVVAVAVAAAVEVAVGVGVVQNNVCAHPGFCSFWPRRLGMVIVVGHKSH